jgi:hypothetical protein
MGPRSASSSPPWCALFRSRLLTLGFPLILTLSLGSSSCSFRKTRTARVFVPPPAKPRPPVDIKIPELPPAPDIEVPAADATAGLQIPSGVRASMPAAGPPPVPPRRPAPPVRVAAPPPPPVVEPPPQPKLGQIFTADQLREYNRSIDDSLDRVKRVVATVAGRNLNAELSEILRRIQTFQKQAEQARDSDLVTAVNLARRADLLAQDLLKRLP